MPTRSRFAFQLLLCPVLLLTACGGAATDQPAQLPAPGPAQTTPQPSAEDAARAALFPLSQAAPLPSDVPFVWLWWDGQTPPDVQAEKWTELNDFRADLQADHAGATRGPQWDAFERELKVAFPLALTVYRLPSSCEGRCKAATVIIEGRAAWGVGGFIGSVQDDE